MAAMRTTEPFTWQSVWLNHLKSSRAWNGVEVKNFERFVENVEAGFVGKGLSLGHIKHLEARIAGRGR